MIWEQISWNQLLPRFRRKNFVKFIFIDNIELYSNLIWRKKFRGSEFIIFFHTVEKRESHCRHTLLWKLLKFTLTIFSQIFRESNTFTKEITKALIWRNIFYVRVFFTFFHTVCHAFFFFRQIELIYSKVLYFHVTLTENFWKNCGSMIP